MISRTLYSSNTDLLETPQWFYENLDNEFHFTLDACAIKENAKCEAFISPQQDALSQPWNGRVWCNPPYGRKIGMWIQKAQKEIHTNQNCKIVVMLIHARTDTKWFHNFLYKKPNVELRFVEGRLKFCGAANCAPFPSMIAILRREED